MIGVLSNDYFQDKLFPLMNAGLWEMVWNEM